jgi:hypothetical protein
MFSRILVASACVLAIGACQNSVTSPGVVGLSGAPSSMLSTSVERPWKAQLTWSATNVAWASLPPGTARSDFDGRCSVPSDYVISAVFEGEATHAGRVTGQTSHCSQVDWMTGSAVYSDGRGTIVSANGSRMSISYGNGVTGMDPETGEMWFQDAFTLTGETGLFEGASGSGHEGGRFADLNAVIGGAPVPMWMDGTLTYGPGK